MNAEFVQSEANRVAAALRAELGDSAASLSCFLDNARLITTPANLIAVLTSLKDRHGYKLLAELGGADYLKYPGQSSTGARFEVHYVVRNLQTNHTLIVKVGADDPNPTIPSATSLWLGADWMEREVYDMYGVVFEGHPDLRRILMPDEFTAYPLRKDYPLRGRGERHNFPRITRAQS